MIISDIYRYVTLINSRDWTLLRSISRSTRDSPQAVLYYTDSVLYIESDTIFSCMVYASLLEHDKPELRLDDYDDYET
jgi:hypothetical protein